MLSGEQVRARSVGSLVSAALRLPALVVAGCSSGTDVLWDAARLALAA
jgi:hypothetical protein